MEQIYWKEKANLNWFLHGDQNTKFFLIMTKSKTTFSAITKLMDNKKCIEKQEDFQNHIISMRIYIVNIQ